MSRNLRTCQWNSDRELLSMTKVVESRDERAVVAVEIPSHLLLQWHDEAAAATSTPKFFHVERLNASIIGQVVIITRSGPIEKRIKVNCCLKSQGIGLEEKRTKWTARAAPWIIIFNSARQRYGARTSSCNCRIAWWGTCSIALTSWGENNNHYMIHTL